MPVVILAIESSCDDTSAAVCKDGKIQANITATQSVHRDWGGVVPELASRAHLQHMVPVVESALKTAGVKKTDIDAVAFTRGPGLIGSLLVGAGFAKGMALALGKPLIEVNHMQAHVLAHFIDNHPRFPFLCLTVSGGHTQLLLVNDYFEQQVIGETLDDAAGEAFDKTSKLLGIPYPGGPAMDRLSKTGDLQRFQFPEPKVPELDFSFSGLKTSVLYFLQREQSVNPNFISENLNDLCASIQHTIVNILIAKLRIAAEKHAVKDIALAGGVAANSLLRERFGALGRELNMPAHIPAFGYCTDNAAMIAIAAYHKFLKKDFATHDCEPLARMPF